MALSEKVTRVSKKVRKSYDGLTKSYDGLTKWWDFIFFMFNSLFQDARKLSQLYASFLIPVPPFPITYSDISISISAVRLAGSLSQPPPPSFLNQASQAPRPSTQRSRQYSLKLLWPPRFSRGHLLFQRQKQSPPGGRERRERNGYTLARRVVSRVSVRWIQVLGFPPLAFK